MAKGLTIEEARKLTNKDVAQALGGLPSQKMHCSNLACDALQKAIDDYLGLSGESKEVKCCQGCQEE